MSTATSTTQTMTTAEAKTEFDSLVHRVGAGETRIVIEQDGAMLAVLISAEEFARLTRLEEQDHAWRVLDAMRAPFEGVSFEEIEREAAKAVAEVRAEMRAERAAKRQPS